MNSPVGERSFCFLYSVREAAEVCRAVSFPPFSSKPQEDQRVLLKALNEFILCFLCKGFLVSATTSDCLHSFCENCILTHMQSHGTRKCPVCQEEIGHLQCPLDKKTVQMLKKPDVVKDSRKRAGSVVLYLLCQARVPIQTLKKFIRLSYNLLESCETEPLKLNFCIYEPIREDMTVSSKDWICQRLLEKPGTVEQGTVDSEMEQQGTLERGRMEEGLEQQGTLECGRVDNAMEQQITLERGRVDNAMEQQGTLERGRVDNAMEQKGTLERGRVDNAMEQQGTLERGRLEEGLEQQGTVDNVMEQREIEYQGKQVRGMEKGSENWGTGEQGLEEHSQNATLEVIFRKHDSRDSDSEEDKLILSENDFLNMKGSSESPDVHDLTDPWAQSNLASFESHTDSTVSAASKGNDVRLPELFASTYLSEGSKRASNANRKQDPSCTCSELAEETGGIRVIDGVSENDGTLRLNSDLTKKPQGGQMASSDTSASRTESERKDYGTSTNVGPSDSAIQKWHRYMGSSLELSSLQSDPLDLVIKQEPQEFITTSKESDSSSRVWVIDREIKLEPMEISSPTSTPDNRSTTRELSDSQKHLAYTSVKNASDNVNPSCGLSKAITEKERRSDVDCKSASPRFGQENDVEQQVAPTEGTCSNKRLNPSSAEYMSSYYVGSSTVKNEPADKSEGKFSGSNGKKGHKAVQVGRSASSSDHAETESTSFKQLSVLRHVVTSSGGLASVIDTTGETPLRTPVTSSIDVFKVNLDEHPLMASYYANLAMSKEAGGDQNALGNTAFPSAAFPSGLDEGVASVRRIPEWVMASWGSQCDKTQAAARSSTNIRSQTRQHEARGSPLERRQISVPISDIAAAGHVPSARSASVRAGPYPLLAQRSTSSGQSVTAPTFEPMLSTSKDGLIPPRRAETAPGNRVLCGGNLQIVPKRTNGPIQNQRQTLQPTASEICTPSLEPRTDQEKQSQLVESIRPGGLVPSGQGPMQFPLTLNRYNSYMPMERSSFDSWLEQSCYGGRLARVSPVGQIPNLRYPGQIPNWRYPMSPPPVMSRGSNLIKTDVIANDRRLRSKLYDYLNITGKPVRKRTASSFLPNQASARPEGEPKLKKIATSVDSERQQRVERASTAETTVRTTLTASTAANIQVSAEQTLQTSSLEPLNLSTRSTWSNGPTLGGGNEGPSFSEARSF
ncbi:hypothetical protein ACOMHN_005980 [Nucella lapillus]